MNKLGKRVNAGTASALAASHYHKLIFQVEHGICGSG